MPPTANSLSRKQVTLAADRFVVACLTLSSLVLTSSFLNLTVTFLGYFPDEAMSLGRTYATQLSPVCMSSTLFYVVCPGPAPYLVLATKKMPQQEKKRGGIPLKYDDMERSPQKIVDLKMQHTGEGPCGLQTNKPTGIKQSTDCQNPPATCGHCPRNP